MLLLTVGLYVLLTAVISTTTVHSYDSQATDVDVAGAAESPAKIADAGGAPSASLSDNSCAGSVFVVESSTSSEPSSSASKSGEDAVDTSSHKAFCHCTPIGDVICNGGLTVLPRFVASDRTYRSLYLDRQLIRTLPPGAFRNLSISRIVLNFNPIGQKVSSSAFDGLQSVVSELELGAIGITSLPPGLIDGMGRLRRLQLWSNSIKRLPAGWFCSAEVLEELQLWNNEINELDNRSLGCLWNLRRLDLDRNLIQTLQRDLFRHLPELELLRIGENRITTIVDGVFSHMVRLRALSLDRNRINYVHERAFDKLSRLVFLDLTANEINFLPDKLFEGLGELVELRLAGNRMQFVLTRTFFGLHSLRRLDLSANWITRVSDGAFRHSPSLEQLLLDDNRLTTLQHCAIGRTLPVEAGGTAPGGSDSVTRTTQPLRMLSLTGNPVTCSCELAWLVWKVPSNNTSASGRGREVADRPLRVTGTCHGGQVSSWARTAEHNGGLTFEPGTGSLPATRHSASHGHYHPLISRLTALCPQSTSGMMSHQCPFF